jgi:hypothetical protein
LIELLGEKDIPYFQHILGNWIKYGRRGEEGIEIILFLYLDHQEGRIFFLYKRGLERRNFKNGILHAYSLSYSMICDD